MSDVRDPLSVRSLVAGLLVTIIGGVTVAILTRPQLPQSVAPTETVAQPAAGAPSAVRPSLPQRNVVLNQPDRHEKQLSPPVAPNGVGDDVAPLRGTLFLRPDEIKAAQRGHTPYHGYLNDQVLVALRPVYSAVAKQCTSQTQWPVEIKVDESGTVVAARGYRYLLRSDKVCDDLAAALEAAALAARFPPAIVDGRRVAVGGSLLFEVRQIAP